MHKHRKKKKDSSTNTTSLFKKKMIIKKYPRNSTIISFTNNASEVEKKITYQEKEKNEISSLKLRLNYL